MRARLVALAVVASLVVPLMACTPPNDSPEVGGGGAYPCEKDLTCSMALVQGGYPCDYGASSVLDDLVGCACFTDPCAALCDDLCMAGSASDECLGCMGQTCAAELMACQNGS